MTLTPKLALWDSKRIKQNRRNTMHRLICLLAPLVLAWPWQAFAQNTFEEDVVKTSEGDLTITFVGHGTLMFSFNDKVIHVDPFSRLADYSTMPKADLLLVTHEHGDHFDPKAIKLIRTEQTVLLTNKVCAGKIDGATIMKNGDVKNAVGVKVEAVPAYNPEKAFHPKGRDNGFVITFGDKRVYVAGDTEKIPEMANLKDIDIAFLPMNLPYTMTPEMAAEAALSFMPKIYYPYHTGETDVSRVVDLLKDAKDIEIRLRKME
jgi:L-ascorbate metabolism protein UlaG (beta-lactamase superfamily)